SAPRLLLLVVVLWWKACVIPGRPGVHGSHLAEDYRRRRGSGYGAADAKEERYARLLAERLKRLSLSRFMVYCASHNRRHPPWRMYSAPPCRIAPQNS